MDQEEYTRHVNVLRERMQALYRRGSKEAQQNEVLAQAFEELFVASDALQAATSLMRNRNRQRAEEHETLEGQLLRYQELFQEAPAGYLISSPDGTIQHANSAACARLGVPERKLIGRSLALFVPEGRRREFRAAINEFSTRDRRDMWLVEMQNWDNEPFTIECVVVAVRSPHGKTRSLRWMFQDVGVLQREQEILRQRLNELEQRLSDGGASDGHGPYETAAQLRQHYAILAESSVLLAVAYEPPAALSHLSHVLVPALASACVIDLHTINGWLRLVVTDKATPENGVPAPRWQPLTLDGNGRNRLTALLDGADDSSTTILLDRARLQQSLGSEVRAIQQQLHASEAIITPLWARSRCEGVIALFNDEGRSFTPADTLLMEELGSRAAVVLDRALYGTQVRSVGA